MLSSSWKRKGSCRGNGGGIGGEGGVMSSSCDVNSNMPSIAVLAPYQSVSFLRWATASIARGCKPSAASELSTTRTTTRKMRVCSEVRSGLGKLAAMKRIRSAGRRSASARTCLVVSSNEIRAADPST